MSEILQVQGGRSILNRRFYILSVDGGGLRGAYSAYILKRMEEEWDIEWREKFGLFAGTSTGSIIASGLANCITASSLFNLYVEKGQLIFSRRWVDRLLPFGLSSLVASSYDNKPLRASLGELFGDTRLKDISVPLIVPSVDIGGGRVHVFKSAYDPEFHRDPKVRVADAVMASCSAPTYFDPYMVNKYPLIDGGLWANNPSLVAAIEAQRRLGVDLCDVKILSVGTGISKTCYESTAGWFRDTLLGWGIGTRWGRRKFVELMLNLQAESTFNSLNLLLEGRNGKEPEQLLRINFESDKPLPMDRLGKLTDWTRQADQDFTHKGRRIKEFLEL